VIGVGWMGLASITCFFILMIYLVIQKHCKLYGIVVIMSPGNLLEIISAGLLDTLFDLRSETFIGTGFCNQ